MLLLPFMALECPLILEIHLKLFQKQSNTLTEKDFQIYKKGKALKNGGGGRGHRVTPPPPTPPYGYENT